MDSISFEEAYRRELLEAREALVSHMATGGCKSYEEYRELVGQVVGLTLAEGKFLDLLHKARKEG